MVAGGSHHTIMKYGEIKLTVGLQCSNQGLVQYCITVPQQPK